MGVNALNDRIMQGYYSKKSIGERKHLATIKGLCTSAHPYIVSYELSHEYDSGNNASVRIEVTCVSGLVISSKAHRIGPTGATYWRAVRACRDEVNTKLTAAVAFLEHQLKFLDKELEGDHYDE